MRIKFVVLLSCLFLVALIGAGCGSFTELESRKPLDTIKVDMTSAPRTLEPREIVLDRPGTYAFEVKNTTDDVAHALEIKSKDGSKVDFMEGSARTKDLAPGESNPVFNVHLAPGTYKIFDPIGHHEAIGEEGTITVKKG